MIGPGPRAAEPMHPLHIPGRPRSAAPRAARLVLGAATALTLIASAWDRGVNLGRIPGINGDEAWYGVQMERMLAGEPPRWTTPSGLPLNPVHVGPLALFLKAFGPAPWVLRAPALASGLLLLPMACFLLAGPLDRPTALLATLLLAAHPALIAYSRFGWDASHSPLIGLLVLALALRGRAVATLGALMVALLVHPTNVFLAPVAVLPILATRRAGGAPGPTGRPRRSAIGAAALGLLGVGIAAIVSPPDPAAALRFLADLGHLLAGPSIYEYIAGPIGDRATLAYDVLAWGLGPILAALGTYRMIRRRQWDRLSIGAGVVLGAGAIGLIGGPGSIRPHHERYGLFLVVPAMAYLACCLGALIPPETRPSRLPRGSGVLALTLGVCWASLWGFQRFYFDVFRTSGGASHRAFRTAAIEPKQEALAIILRDLASEPSREHRPVPILTGDWWLSWPIRFLADDRKDLVITDVQEMAPGERAPALRSALRQEGYAVGFVGEGIEEMIRSSPEAGRLRTWDILDRAGRPLIRVYRLEPRRP